MSSNETNKTHAWLIWHVKVAQLRIDNNANLQHGPVSQDSNNHKMNKHAAMFLNDCALAVGHFGRAVESRPATTIITSDGNVRKYSPL